MITRQIYTLIERVGIKIGEIITIIILMVIYAVIIGLYKLLLIMTGLIKTRQTPASWTAKTYRVPTLKNLKRSF